MSRGTHFDIAIIGGGIVGLAHAYVAAQKGFKVVVFERTSKSVGASRRNFGLIWPMGQEAGKYLERAKRSREIWLELSMKAGFSCHENGSVHLANHQDEWEVLEEFFENANDLGYDCQLLNATAIATKSPAIKLDGLIGGLWSSMEMTVDPREALDKITAYLDRELNVHFNFDTVVNRIDFPKLYSGNSYWTADQIFVCSGSDFETLYPETYEDSGMTKCKLQMMRAQIPFYNWQLGPTLCGGLTLRHYTAFKHCSAIKALDERFKERNPEFDRWGIHVLLAQNASGELVIGDSHEYGWSPEPFDKEEINQIILKYLKTFTELPPMEITERWHGVYSKLEGKNEFVYSPETGVTIVNGLGGAGMTLSFGLAEENINRMDAKSRNQHHPVSMKS
ncbi:TIGR03364 family FAD-dependent oxidoreductase [Fulvivirgaceae bacterium BMA10]|uniref:TIGR03364 family FAD-dependent oxidoreductase n=1 Tax=Splendidivirga corallicola TaxID=3051826 RepID=A0ABT8KVZ3_9BACT|nr:TIGR03364 family FAD-dependent oxidoreductase [Fulvivirgaceae bacterium BMA10]